MHCILDAAGIAFSVTFAVVRRSIEHLHLGPEVHGISGGIETGHVRNARFSGKKIGPEFVRRISERTHAAHSCNDYFFHFFILLIVNRAPNLLKKAGFSQDDMPKKAMKRM